MIHLSLMSQNFKSIRETLKEDYFYHKIKMMKQIYILTKCSWSNYFIHLAQTNNWYKMKINYIWQTFEPCHEKTGYLPMRKQRRRSAVQ